MIQKFLLAAAGAVALGSFGTMASSQNLPIEWTISPTGSDGQAGPNVQLALSYRLDGSRNMNSRSHALSELQGLTAEQLSSTQGAPANFSLVREAGRIDCNGIVQRWRGTGECNFLPNAAFATALERRGIGRPSLQQQYQLTVQNVGTPLLQELERLGYRQPDLKGFIAAGIHGVSAMYVRSMADAGYRLGDVDDLVKFRIHGVTADYVKEMGLLNPPGGRFSAEELVSMRIHGLSAEKVRQYAALGYRNLSHKQLMSMSIHGVTPAFIRELSEVGYRDLGAEDLIKMRIHGVTPDYIQEMRAAGYQVPSADQLVRMRISGFRPDRRKK